MDGRLRLALGSKFEHNSYTGFEIQPSTRLAWTPASHHTVWAAVSRAVRTPARIDRGFFLFLAPSVPLVAFENLQSEEVLATELGWRVQPRERVSLALSTFYNDYDNLRTAEPGPPPFGIPITLGNGLQRSHAQARQPRPQPRHSGEQRPRASIPDPVLGRPARPTRAGCGIPVRGRAT